MANISLVWIGIGGHTLIFHFFSIFFFFSLLFFFFFAFDYQRGKKLQLLLHICLYKWGKNSTFQAHNIMALPVKFCSYNIKGCKNPIKRNRIITFYKKGECVNSIVARNTSD